MTDSLDAASEAGDRLDWDEEFLPLSEPKVIDPAAVNPTTGQPKHQIIKTTDPHKYVIRVSDYLLS